MNPAPLLARLDDRLPPMLVKEGRQALRGRTFSYSFLVALVLALLLCWRWADVQGSNPDGRELLGVLTGILMLPAVLLVPLGAFQSMSAEYEQRTVEDLQLSALSPLSLAGGKLLAALVQLALYVCAFAPFVALAAVAGGVGIGHVAEALLMVAGAGFVMTSWALVLGTLGRNRIARTLLMFVLVVFGLSLLGFSMQLATVLIGSGSASFRPGWAVLFQLLGNHYLIPGVAGLAVAATRLAHPATNTSTPLRWTATACLAASTPLLAIAAHASGADARAFGGFLAILAVGLAVCAVFFTTEPDPLPRPVRTRLAARAPRPFEAFWLPGGGRGVAWYWLHGGLLLALGSVLGATLPRGGSGDAGVIDAPLAALLLGNAYVLLPATLLAGWCKDPSRRTVVRWIPALLSVGGLLLTAFLNLVTGGDIGFEHPLNPFWILEEVAERGLESGPGLFALVLGILAGAPPATRMFAGLREPGLVRAVARARREEVVEVEEV